MPGCWLWWPFTDWLPGFRTGALAWQCRNWALSTLLWQRVGLQCGGYEHTRRGRALFHRCLVAMILGTGPPSSLNIWCCHRLLPRAARLEGWGLGRKAALGLCWRSRRLLEHGRWRAPRPQKRTEGHSRHKDSACNSVQLKSLAAVARWLGGAGPHATAMLALAAGRQAGLGPASSFAPATLLAKTLRRSCGHRAAASNAWRRLSSMAAARAACTLCTAALLRRPSIKADKLPKQAFPVAWPWSLAPFGGL